MTIEHQIYSIQVTTDNCNTYYFFVKDYTPWNAALKIKRYCKNSAVFKKFISQWIPFVDKYVHNIKLKDSFELHPKCYLNPKIIDVQPIFDELSSYSSVSTEEAYNELPED